MGNLQPSIDNAEHIGPNTTGDNIQAKRVANYGWDGSNWQRQPFAAAGFIPFAYDTTVLTQTTLTDIYTYKTGGVNGTTVCVKTITFTDATKTTWTTKVRT